MGGRGAGWGAGLVESLTDFPIGSTICQDSCRRQQQTKSLESRNIQNLRNGNFLTRHIVLWLHLVADGTIVNSSSSPFHFSQSTFFLHVINIILIYLLDDDDSSWYISNVHHPSPPPQCRLARGIVLTGCQWVPQRENLSWNHCKRHLAFRKIANFYLDLFGFLLLCFVIVIAAFWSIVDIFFLRCFCLCLFSY